ncbi:autophagy-related protein 22-like protein [Melampsora americana]|nr:autophagy-related protein 22-like protein [Melampsora americana]
MGPTRYSLTLLQSLANAAGFDPKGGPGFKCTTAGHCVIPFGAGHRATTVNSVVLIANAISFAIMTFIYTAFGGCADHGYFDQWILLFLSGFWWGSQLGLIGVTDPTQWRAAMALYIIGFTTYGAALVFIAASLPRLSRNMPYARKARSDFRRGLIQQEEYDQRSSLEKNRLSMISSVHFNIGSFFTLLLSLAIVGLNATARSTTNWTIAVVSIFQLPAFYSIVVGIWWFLFHQKRPGLPLPKGQSYLTIGVWTLYRALKECRHLPQTFLYLFASFLLADGVNTTTTLIYIVQGEAVTFSSLRLTYLNLAQAGTSAISVWVWWFIQRHYNLKTKQMFTAATVATVIIPLWGTLGIFMDKIGFHNSWEFWMYNFFVAVFQTPYYAYSVTMMAELTPPGHEKMFFSLYGFSNRASSLIGPSIIQAIINRTGSNWSGRNGRFQNLL